MIAAARASKGRPMDEVVTAIEASISQFGKNAKAEFNRAGEWD